MHMGGNSLLCTNKASITYGIGNLLRDRSAYDINHIWNLKRPYFSGMKIVKQVGRLMLLEFRIVLGVGYNSSASGWGS